MSARRVNATAGLFVFIFIALSCRTAYLMLSDENKNRSNLAILARGSFGFHHLIEHAAYLKGITDNIENVPLGKIREALEQTSHLIDLANRDIEVQSDAWASIKGSMNNDAKAYAELQKSIAAAQSAQANEIVRLQALLDEARSGVGWSYTWNTIVSILIGVLISVVATALQEPIKELIKSRFQKGS